MKHNHDGNTQAAMTRLPTPGSDEGVWGDILNEFLLTSHNGDGTIRESAVQDGLPAASNGYALIYNSSTSQWEGQAIGGGDPAMGGDLSGTASNAQIAAGAIVNADINASAAIAQSKVANLTSDLAGKEPVVTAGTTSQYYRGDKSWQVLDKAAVGLANVDNTSDINKPVSTAQQTALDAKADAVTVGWIKIRVRTATTVNIALSGTQTVDGIALAIGDRVLVRSQTNEAENGVYVVASGAWSRATDMDTTAKVASALVAVDLGSINGLSLWFAEFTTLAILGTSSMRWKPLKVAETDGTITDGKLPARLRINGAQVSDWSNVFQNGFYWSAGNATNAPAVITGEWTGIHQFANNNSTQLLVEGADTGTPKLWSRAYNSLFEGWNPWYQIGGDGVYVKKSDADTQLSDLRAYSATTLSTGQSTMPRREVVSSGVSLATGALRLTYFIATKSETITKFRTLCGITAAGATPTLCRIGLYTVAGNGDLTLVASTANTTSLWNAANTAFETNLTASYAVTSGTNYAIGILIVSSFAAPALQGQTVLLASEAAMAPRLNGQLTGQSDLPASITSASVAVVNTQFYVVLSP